jgi:hypothetical protein
VQQPTYHDKRKEITNEKKSKSEREGARKKKRLGRPTPRGMPVAGSNLPYVNHFLPR